MVVVSDGTAVLGLGDIGAGASLPVMEGKSALFKAFGDLDSIPLVLDTTNVDEIVETLVRLRPSFGAVNLEDVSAPRCFELEETLIEALDCPVMHDDQHGTAVVVLAALTDAAKVDRPRTRVAARGGLAAPAPPASPSPRSCSPPGSATSSLLDSRGVINSDRADITVDSASKKAQLAAERQPARHHPAALPRPCMDADVFVGVSSSKLAEEHLKLDEPGRDRVRPVQPGSRSPAGGRAASTRPSSPRAAATSRTRSTTSSPSPAIFRGALDAGARRITPAMKLAAARAIADLADEDLSADYIVPSPLDPRVAPAVSAAVAAAVEAE